jgi:hypothetical protein
VLMWSHLKPINNTKWGGGLKLTVLFDSSNALIRMMTKGICEWSVTSRLSKSSARACISSESNGLSSRREGAVSEWVSITEAKGRMISETRSSELMG